uniref:Reverse transcriptase domain-containing protein n=1 Tax=Amphimedon queenslandica TaxID=400682 RepID=A0A1X7TD12_AMPQE
MKSTLKEKSVPDFVSSGDSSVSSDLGKATLFNQFFHSVFSDSLPPPTTSTLSPPAYTLPDFEITVGDVFKGLSSLNIRKASGIDNIPSIVLKSCATALCEPLHHLFVQCLSQAYIPQEWKIHRITPIFKSGDRTLVKN